MKVAMMSSTTLNKFMTIQGYIAQSVVIEVSSTLLSHQTVYEIDFVKYCRLL